MKMLEKAGNFVTNNLIWFVIGVTIVALAWPQTFGWASGIVNFMLGVIMFCMGMTMQFEDFAEVIRNPLQVLIVEVLQYGVMPFIAVALSRIFKLEPKVAIGLILIGCVPGGTSSNVIGYLSHANVPVSIAATSLSTLVAPILTPSLLYLFGNELVEIDFWGMFWDMIKIVLVPVFLGMLVHRILPRFSAKIQGVLPFFATLAVLVVLGGTVSTNQHLLLTSGLTIYLCVAIQNASGYIVGYVACILLKQKRASTRAISIEVAMQNVGLAAGLGMKFFGAEAALPGAAGCLLHNAIGAIYANLCVRKDEKELEARKGLGTLPEDATIDDMLDEPVTWQNSFGWSRNVIRAYKQQKS